MPNPFATAQTQTQPQPEAPQTEAPQTEAPQTEAPAAKAAGGKGKTVKDGTRKKPNRPVTPDDIKFIIDNYATMQTAEIAAQLGLTRMQVYQNMRKVREKLLAQAAEIEATDPQKAAKIKAFVEEKLPSKKDQFGGGARKGQSAVDQALKDLGIM